MCLRDDIGTFVLAKQLHYDHVMPVAIGEALGLLHTLQWMQDMQFDNIDLELDSKVTRDAFQFPQYGYYRIWKHYQGL